MHTINFRKKTEPVAQNIGRITMDDLRNGVLEAFRLLLTLDSELLGICWVSIKVSTISTMLSAIVGVPLGFIVASRQFPGKRTTTAILNTLMAVPTVVVGLFVYSMVSRSGPLGPLGLLYTPHAMVIGQFFLATPLIACLTMNAIEGLDPRVRMTARTLGATHTQAAWTMLNESRFAVLGAVIAGFARVFAEVGISMMLGGNIRGYTRNITTAIAMETAEGDFALGIALGIVLLTVAFAINILLHHLQIPRRSR